MHRTSSINTPRSTPKDPHHLKRRHTRGNTSQSQNSLHSLSSSPPSPLSISTSNRSRQHSKRDEDLHRSSPSPAPTRSKKLNEDLGDDDIFRPQQSTVPTWFGSLRSFALSAKTSSRGAFSPLVPSSSSSSSPPRSQSSNTSPSRGRSSSIYYAGTLDGDSDSDESGREQDEPITSMNGLKENRIRGPRMGWTMLDPSLCGVFSQPYSAVPGSESDLSSPSGDSSTMSSSLSSPTFSNVDELGISEETFQDHTQAVSAIHYGGPPPPDDAIQAYQVAPKSAGSAFAFLKSYVPSFSASTTGPISLGSDDESHKTASTKCRTTISGSKTATSSDGPSAGWSLRKLSLNFLSSNQYEAVRASESNDDDEEVDEDIAASLGIGSTPAYRDDPDEEDAVERKRDGDGQYNGSIKGLTTSTVPPPPKPLSSPTLATKARQYISTDLLRDALEQLPVTSRSFRKQGRTD